MRVHGLQTVEHPRHMGHVDCGLRDAEEIDDPIRAGDGKQVRAIRKGALHQKKQ